MSAPHADRDHSEQPCCGDHNHEPCRGCPDGRDAGTSRPVSARVVRASEAQVEAAHKVAWNLHDGGDRFRLSQNAARAIADAVVAAGVDADEVTRLRAEVERLTHSARTAWDVHAEHVETSNLRTLHWQAVADDWKRRKEAAEAERDRMAEVVARGREELAIQTAQTEAAKTKVARVEALADEQWLDPVNYKAPVSLVLEAIQKRLRAALSGPSPAQTPATATEPAPRAAGDAGGQSGTGEAQGGAEKGEAHWRIRYDEGGEPYGEVCRCEIGEDHDANGETGR